MRPDPLRNTVGESRKTRTANLPIWDIALLNPIRDEDIRFALLCTMAIRSKHQLLPVGRKHRKAIKGVVVSYALQAGAVRLNHVEIEIAALRIGNVRRENYPLAVGKEIGCEAGFV